MSSTTTTTATTTPRPVRTSVRAGWTKLRSNYTFSVIKFLVNLIALFAVGALAYYGVLKFPDMKSLGGAMLLLGLVAFVIAPVILVNIFHYKGWVRITLPILYGGGMFALGLNWDTLAKAFSGMQPLDIIVFALFVVAVSALCVWMATSRRRSIVRF